MKFASHPLGAGNSRFPYILDTSFACSCSTVPGIGRFLWLSHSHKTSLLFSFPVFHNSICIKSLLQFCHGFFIPEWAFSVSYRPTLDFSNVKMSHDVFYCHLLFSLVSFIFIFVFSSSTTLFFGGKGYNQIKNFKCFNFFTINCAVVLSYGEEKIFSHNQHTPYEQFYYVATSFDPELGSSSRRDART